MTFRTRALSSQPRFFLDCNDASICVAVFHLDPCREAAFHDAVGHLSRKLFNGVDVGLVAARDHRAMEFQQRLADGE